MRMIALALVFFLSGCNLAQRLANGAVVEPDGEVIEPNGEVVEPDGHVIEPQDYQGQTIERHVIEYEGDMCLVRARHFHGLVRIPCDQIAREPAP